uniref:Ig-like domain-containing protein n=1 Tax=Sus scrofa TaxID=9823 RepID=A0A8D1T7Q3_PIG
MAPWHWVAWLTPALLLLWLPGCLSLSGPSTVMGIEGGSLSVQCRYEEEYIDDKKYWEKSPCFLSWKHTVETTESAREVRRGRVSIRDDPANLTFTVTLERLTEEDAGTYCCGINAQFSVDPTHEVEVVVFQHQNQGQPFLLQLRSRQSYPKRQRYGSLPWPQRVPPTAPAAWRRKPSPSRARGSKCSCPYLYSCCFCWWPSPCWPGEWFGDGSKPMRIQSCLRTPIRLLRRARTAMKMWSCQGGPLRENLRLFNPHKGRWNTAWWDGPVKIFTTARWFLTLRIRILRPMESPPRRPGRSSPCTA